ncbi:MAG TPA: pyrroline-5-carboxylate reductase [Candidatus Faecalicoccus intestinipullorum]|nr:pyrroline-5-carboxylate reductase [Candidatus Faecalicoccus intestinipullorum]
MRIGCIGFGNMAQAIVQGLIKQGKIAPSMISVCAAHYERCQQNAKKYGVQAYESSLEVIQNSDWILLAVKPYQISDVLEPIKEELVSKVVVSIAAGVYFEDYEKMLVSGTHHISSIPNTPVAIGKGIFVSESKNSLDENEVKVFEEIFGSLGLVEWIETSHLSIAGTIAGCAPAYTAMYLEALGDAGVKHGLTRAQAYRLAAQMIEGTGSLYLAQGQHPAQMKDAVCSPGGTTIKGVASLEKNAFRGIVIAAIDSVETD